jgi:hypothetical protein
MNSSITWDRAILFIRSFDISDTQAALKYVLIASSSLFLIFFWKKDRAINAPFVGYRGFWEPTLLLRLRFTHEAWPIIMEGYRHVTTSFTRDYPLLCLISLQFKDGMFQIRRNDSDILVISNKYVDELKSLPEAKLSATEAHVKVNLFTFIRSEQRLTAVGL